MVCDTESVSFETAVTRVSAVKKSSNKTFVSYFMSEFKSVELVRSIVNLISLYLVTVYVQDNRNPIMYVVLGLIFINAQKAADKYIVRQL